MPDAAAAPFWAAPALLAALIAVLGYLGKTAADFILQLRQTARARRTQLAELHALLRAGDVAFAAQRDLRKRLAAQLRERIPATAQLSPGFDRLFVATYPEMNPDERQLLSLIRAITVFTFRPLNQALLDWLHADHYFRAIPPGHRRLGSLAIFLAQLEAHLVLWVAKYEAWIPDHPEHAVVFLADEEQHGVGFPRNGTALVAAALGHPGPPPPAPTQG